MIEERKREDEKTLIALKREQRKCLAGTTADEVHGKTLRELIQSGCLDFDFVERKTMIDLIVKNLSS